MRALVGEPDERAWDVRGEVDARRSLQEACLVAFSLARAASAVWFALTVTSSRPRWTLSMRPEPPEVFSLTSASPFRV